MAVLFEHTDGEREVQVSADEPDAVEIRIFQAGANTSRYGVVLGADAVQDLQLALAAHLYANGPAHLYADDLRP